MLHLACRTSSRNLGGFQTCVLGAAGTLKFTALQPHLTLMAWKVPKRLVTSIFV